MPSIAQMIPVLIIISIINSIILILILKFIWQILKNSKNKVSVGK
jgi:hypothetical protein